MTVGKWREANEEGIVKGTRVRIRSTSPGFIDILITKKVFTFGPFELDPREKTLFQEGQPVGVTPKAFDLLLFLVMRPGRLVSREEILESVWPETTVEEGNLSVHISNLRRLLGEQASEPQYIETVARRGYRFIGTVTEATVTEAALTGSAATEGSVTGASVSGEAGAGTGKTAWEIGWAGALLSVVAAVAGVVWFVSFRRPESDWNPMPVTSTPGLETSPALSPDGSQVVFAVRTPREQKGLWLQQVGGSRPTQLTGEFDYNPAWSPNGREIAYFRFRQPVLDLRIQDAFGGASQVLATFDYRGPLPGPMLSYTPDGEWILTSEGTGTPLGAKPRQLVAISRRSGEKRRILEPVAGTSGDSAPVLSPKKDQLAFCRCVSPDSCDLYVVPVADLQPTGPVERITESPSPEFRPVYLKDGSLVYPLGPAELRMLRRTVFGMFGRVETRTLSAAGEDVLQPTVGYTESGKLRIAYARSTVDTDVWRMEFNGPDGDVKKMSRLISSTRADETPDYSPDGKHIAFSSTRSGQWEIWRCTAEGQDCQQFTNLGPNLSRSPSWSADGRWIAFDSRPTSVAQIYLIPAEGGKPEAWTSGPHSHLYPQWSPDGKWLYFSSNRSGRYEVYRSPAPSSAKSAVTYERVTTDGGAQPRVSPDGKTVVFRGPDTVCYRITEPEGKAVRLAEGFITPPVAGPGTLLYGFFAERPKGYLSRWDWATGKVQHLSQVDFTRPVGMSRSPDGRTLAFVQSERNESDVMYVDLEPFR